MPQPADHKVPDTLRGDYRVDPKTGIATVDGQILDTTEIDPESQDRLKGFPGVKDPQNPEKG